MRADLCLAFDVLYARAQASFGFEGPLCLSSHLVLLLRFAAWRPRQVLWAEILEHGGKKIDFCYFYLQATALLPPYQRSQARFSLMSYMHSLGLPTSMRLPLCVVSALWKPVLKTWVKSTFRVWSACAPHWVDFCRARTLLVVKPASSWRFRLMNVQRVVRKACLLELLGLPLSSLDAFARGLDNARSD